MPGAVLRSLYSQSYVGGRGKGSTQRQSDYMTKSELVTDMKPTHTSSKYVLPLNGERE